MSQLEILLVAAVLSLAGKIVWDWFSQDKTQGRYLPVEVFEKHKANCCAIQIKRELQTDKVETARARAECHAWMEDTEKRIDKGDKIFDLMASDIQKIKTDVAVILSRLDRP